MHSTLRYLLFFTLFISCSNATKISKLKVIQTAFFTTQEFVGNIPVDDKDNPLQKGYWLQHFIIIEVKPDETPKWESLMINNKEIAINFFSIHQTPIYLGKEISTLKNIIVASTKNSKLMLLKVEDYSTEMATLKPPFVLTGKWNEKTVKITIKNEPVFLENERRP